MHYEEKKFSIPALEGISQKSVEEHIGLYGGYVKNFNSISTLIEELLTEPEKNSIAIAELRRRHSFEFDGMRLHEIYFAQFEGGAHALDTASPLGTAIAHHWGTAQAAEQRIRQVGAMRGPGWSVLYYNPEVRAFHMGFIEEQHQGVFATLPIIAALDVWEHAFLLDYGATGRAKYIDAFFKNLNWSVCEERFVSATK